MAPWRIDGYSDRKSMVPSDNDLQTKQEDRGEESRFVASVTVTHVPGTTYQTRIDTGDLALIGDEPVEAGGDGLGPNPYELLLAALGQCTVLTIVLYARRKGWPVNGVSVRARHERVVVAEEIEGESIRKKVERIVQEIALQGNLDEDQRARLIEIAGKCPVHRTLAGDLEILEREVDFTPAAMTRDASVSG
jgi:uncharacterized OsmC-like protein